MSFDGRRVLSLESRRQTETAELIRRNNGDPFVAPSMREIPAEQNQPAFEFADRLLAGGFDMAIFLTGVGTRFLFKTISSRHPIDHVADPLKRIVTVARGPKPASALREIGVTPTIFVPEPNTWREILDAIKDRTEQRVAVQEYGKRAPELMDGLEARGMDVTAVPVYHYDYPEDREPLRQAARHLSEQAFDVTLFTSSQQLLHLLETAEEMGLRDSVRIGLNRTVIASIGPTMSEALREHGFAPDVEPSHPKLGILVKETAEASKEVLWRKRN